MTQRPVVLLINPNTSASVTDRLAAEARRAARDRVDILAVTAPFGATAIQTPDELAVAERAVLACLAAARHCHAAIIGAFGDPGLKRAGENASFPVFGLGRSGILAAAQNGRRFAIVTAGTAMRDDVTAMVRDAGVIDQLATLHFVSATIADIVREPATFSAMVLQAAEGCMRDDGAQAVLLGGGPLVGMAAKFRARLPVPLFDGMEAAVDNAVAALSC